MLGTHMHMHTHTGSVSVQEQKQCVRERHRQMRLPVLCTHLLKEKGVWLWELGEVIYHYSVRPYKFRIAAVMSKAFHGVINIWQKTWPFYQMNIFTISFLCSWCEPCVTVHYRVLLLSRLVLLPNQPHTSMYPILPLWDCELKFLLVLKDKAFSPPLWS